MADIAEQIVDLVVEISGEDEVADERDIDLFEEEILDSMAAIELLVAIKDEFGVEFQMNCSTVTRDKGGFFRTREVKRWLQDQLIDYLGSDAHNVTSRPPHMCHAYEVIKERCGIQYASRLTGMPLRKKSGKD